MSNPVSSPADDDAEGAASTDEPSGCIDDEPAVSDDTSPLDGFGLSIFTTVRDALGALSTKSGAELGARLHTASHADLEPIVSALQAIKDQFKEMNGETLRRTVNDVFTESLAWFQATADTARTGTGTIGQPVPATDLAATDAETDPSAEAATRSPNAGIGLGDSSTPTCGHPRHRDFHHHYDQGRLYTNHIVYAAEAAHAREMEGAEINAHAADRVLWQHAETCAHDLRDFIAGLANAAERYLENLGTTVGY